MTQNLDIPNSMPMTKPLEGIPLPDLERIFDYEKGFWEGAKRHALCIQQCTDCRKLRHLPTPMCPWCHSLSYDWPEMSGKGKVYSYVTVRAPVHKALKEKGQTPYNICVVELPEQEELRIVSNVLNIAPEEIYIEMPVNVTFKPSVDDPNVVLPLFVPA